MDCNLDIEELCYETQVSVKGSPASVDCLFVWQPMPLAELRSPGRLHHPWVAAPRSVPGSKPLLCYRIFWVPAPLRGYSGTCVLPMSQFYLEAFAMLL